MTHYVALLRGINVGARTTIPMAELRALAEGMGLGEVRTYIQSGNLLFAAPGSAAVLEEELEKAIEQRFGLAVPLMTRSAKQWRVLADSNPFADAAEKEPNRLMLLVSKRPPLSDAMEAIQARARDGEKVASVAGALWIHYPAGSGTSKLSPSLIDKLIGSPATSRNYRTVQKLAEMLGT